MKLQRELTHEQHVSTHVTRDASHSSAYWCLSDFASCFEVVSVVGVVLQVFQHFRLGRQTRRVNLFLSDTCKKNVTSSSSWTGSERLSTSLCHFRLDEVESDVIFADVVGHVTVGVDRKQVCFAVKEKMTYSTCKHNTVIVPKAVHTF